jgi:adenine-specific DNA-methyltransferase
MEVNKLEGKTLDGVSENVSVLAQAFPEVIIDGKVDFEKLRLVLGEDIEDAEERYSFTWPGKRDAIKLAISRTTGTLRPDKENSKDWDTTQNLFIEGDNLEVLRVLQNTYRGKVKMIYIDPPYNTGKDFVYKDDFKDNIANYKEQAGLEGQSNADTSGRYHTNWLNMMYPRLRLAKYLLRDDGVIFISIDDHEVHNLRKICDEIFGEENFIATFQWKKKGTSTNVAGVQVSSLTEHIVCYSRTSKQALNLRVTSSEDRIYPYNDKEGDFRTSIIEKRSTGDYDRASMKFPIMGLVPREGKRWQIGEAKARELESKNRFLIEEGTIKLKIDKHEENDSTSAQPNLLLDHGSTQVGQKELDELMNGSLFDTPKPTTLLQHLIKIGTQQDSIILDFFSGSGTIAHAVFSQNANDDYNRRFIAVQLPEVTPTDSEARKAGYNTIPEISRERIRRAGEKIKADYTEKLKVRSTPLDVGFKAFTLDTTNFREWDTDTEDINASLLAALDTFKEGRTNEDALYEVLLKYGVDLTEPVEVLSLTGKQVYSLAGNYLLICLEKKITLATIEEMARLNPSRVVCYDDGFENDEVKQNALETLKRAGVEDVRVI